MKKLTYCSFLVVLGAFCFGLLSAASSFAQGEKAMGGVGITVFKDKNFRGSSATYTRDMPSLSGAGFNRNISSLRIGPGERWEICEQANYRGRCVVVYGEESDLGKNNWDNKISSFRKVGGETTPPPGSGAYIVLYDQPNYRGNPSNYKAAAANLNRRAQSVTIGGGIWEFCEGANFTGRCVTIEKSTPNLSTVGLSRRISSARPLDGTRPEPPVGSDWYIVLYSQANYRGAPTNYKSEQSNLRKMTGSITIGKGVWEICSGANFTGRCETLSNSVPNFTTLGFGRMVRSLRPARPEPR